jgi:calcium-dependent protein kinase
MSEKAGTAYYISPEMVRGSYDYRTDIWSIGVLLYVLLVGYPPYDGDPDSVIYDKIRDEKVPFPMKDWARYEPDTKELVRKLLQKDPE